MLRPGNAGSNDVDDHLELLGQVTVALPPECQVGHQPGDDPGLLRHDIVLRVDSAGARHGFVSGLTEANIGHSIGHPVGSGVREVLSRFQEEDFSKRSRWTGPCATAHGWQSSQVSWTCPPGVRMHGSSAGTSVLTPGPFDTSEDFRHTCLITNASAFEIDAAALECRHRGHARVEDRVRCRQD
jgi:hypothetical protein